MRGNPIGETGAEPLLATPRPARMTRLDLGWMDITYPLRQALLKRFGNAVCRF
jgi:hypothetical protein